MDEENLHAGGKWETMNFLGVALKWCKLKPKSGAAN